jgi:hypothetical protein
MPSGKSLTPNVRQSPNGAALERRPRRGATHVIAEPFSPDAHRLALAAPRHPSRLPRALEELPDNQKGSSRGRIEAGGRKAAFVIAALFNIVAALLAIFILKPIRQRLVTRPIGEQARVSEAQPGHHPRAASQSR